MLIKNRSKLGVKGPRHRKHWLNESGSGSLETSALQSPRTNRIRTSWYSPDCSNSTQLDVELSRYHQSHRRISTDSKSFIFSGGSVPNFGGEPTILGSPHYNIPQIKPVHNGEGTTSLISHRAVRRLVLRTLDASTSVVMPLSFNLLNV